MSDEQFIWIVRWGEFQHYRPERDRAPAWIKSYPRQLDDDRYTDLPPRARALLNDLRLAFSRTSSRLRADTETLSKRLGCRVWSGDLERLNHAGFIDIVSRDVLEQRLEQFYSSPRAALASRAPARSREVEVEVEVEPPYPHRVGEPDTEQANPRAVGTNPRANAKRTKAELHQQLLDKAQAIAATWTSGGSDLFEDQLDTLERQHHARLSALEREHLWDTALHATSRNGSDPDDELF